MIGHEQAALAFARPLLKFLKEGPGYGLITVTHLDNRIVFNNVS